MFKRGRGALVAFAAAGTVVALAVATVASAAPKLLLKGPLYGNIPAVSVRGVAAGALPWVVKGSADLTTTHLKVSGKELVVPQGPGKNGKPVPAGLIGTTLGVKSVVAEVSCAGHPGVVTAAAPLSLSGAFSLSTAVKLPAQCMDPIVLVGIGKAHKSMTAWFASTDFLKDYGIATAANIEPPATKTSGTSGQVATTTAKTTKTSAPAKTKTTSTKTGSTAKTTTTTTTTTSSVWA